YCSINSNVHSEPVEIGCLSLMPCSLSGGPLLEQFAEHRVDIFQVDNLLHCKGLRKLCAHLLVLAPKRLVLAWSYFDIRIMLQERHDFPRQQLITNAGVVVPVVAIGSLGSVDIPVRTRVAVVD